MKLVIKTNGDCRNGISLEADGKSLEYFIGAMDIRIRPEGVKIVIDSIDIRDGSLGKKYETRTYYVNGDSILDLEMGEVDEQSTIPEGT